jgi:hypothetical protein
MTHGVERDFHARISRPPGRFIKRKKIQPPARKAGRLNTLKTGLNGFDRQHLPTLVVATGRADDVRWNGAAALATLVQFRCMPAVGGFARAQPHLGHLAFWNSHIGIFISV